MDILFQVITYPIQRLVALLFSLEIADGISVGALLVAALLLCIIFRALIGLHLSIFDDRKLPESKPERPPFHAGLAPNQPRLGRPKD